ARARAARECFSNATLEYAQADVRAIDDLHEAHVHTIRESWVLLDGGPEPIHRGARNGVDGQDGVRIAHRHCANLHLGARDGERIHMRFGGGVEWQGFGVEVGHAHVDGNQVGVVHPCADESGRTVEYDLAIGAAAV